MRQLPRVVANTDINEVVDIEFVRKGKKNKVKVKIGLLREAKANVSEQEQSEQNIKQALKVWLFLILQKI